MRRTALALVLALAAGCGGSPARPSRTFQGDTDPAEDGRYIEDRRAVFALRDALLADDGAALDAMIHPEHGLWIWLQTAGVQPLPVSRWQAGSGVRVSQRLTDDEALAPFVGAGFRDHLVDALERTISAPPDESEEKYFLGRCDGEDGAPVPATAGWMLDRADLTLPEGLDAAAFPPSAAMTRDLVHLHSYDVDIWLLRDHGKLYVAHVVVSSPCEA